MALAHLCKTSSRESPEYRCVALIVDHKLRPGSTEESLAVKDVLTKDFGLEAKILTLNWPVSPAKSTLELAARQARYRALGRACQGLGIDALLTAHHADDVAETVLYRLKTGYDGRGLHGILNGVHIPYCDDIHGVGQSGCPRSPEDSGTIRSMKLEDGGVRLYRPLLGFRKKELVAMCRTHGLKWFEDETNHDTTLTARNAIRSLLVRDRLPRALGVDSLRKVAAVVGARIKEDERAVEAAWNAIDIHLDIRSGQVEAAIAPDAIHSLHSDLRPGSEQHKTRLAMLVKKLSSLVTPSQHLSTTAFTSVVDAAFPLSGGECTSRQLTAGKTMITITKSALQTRLSIGRQLPTIKERAGTSLQLLATTSSGEKAAWTDWQLFDGRYWIRLRLPTSQDPQIRCTIELLSHTHMMDLRSSDPEEHRQLMSLLHDVASQKTRFTLPAILKTPAGGSRSELLALPTLPWSGKEVQRWPGSGSSVNENTVYYEIRYKSVDLETAGKHSIVG